MEPLIVAYCASLKEQGYSSTTIYSRGCSLQQFVQFLTAQNSTLLTAENSVITSYFHLLLQCNFASSTSYGYSSAVYFFYKWLAAKGEILINPSPKPLEQRKGKIPRPLPSQKQIKLICEKLYNSGNDLAYRNGVMVDLMYSAGLRKGEVHNLNVSDITLEDCMVRVKGKGGHERLIPMGKQCTEKLSHYLFSVRPMFIKSGNSPAVFISKKTSYRLTITGIGKAFTQLRKQHCKTLSPHGLRHAFATDLLRQGAPIQDISKMLGHVEMRTTEIYTRIAIRDLKAHHKKFHPRG